MELPSPVLCLALVVAVTAQMSSSSSSSFTSTLGTSTKQTSELTSPTGSYLSYSSIETLMTSSLSSAITTSPILSTITSPSTQITTIGSTTLFEPALFTSNVTGFSSGLTSSSQIFLSGAATSATSHSSTTSTSSAQPTNTVPCNNFVEFCNRSYGNITEVSAHNSPFVKSGNAAANQALDVTAQLNDGIRLLQTQAHFVQDVPHFCHTSCDILDAGPITDYLSDVYKWIRSHPTDIVTILLENGDYRPVTDYIPFLESTGLVRYAYIPPKIPMNSTDWPTLSEMILSGKRCIFFMDYEANQTAVPWILDEFSQLWETPFDPTNRSFPCTVQRPPNLDPAQAKTRLYMMNHNLNYDISILGNSLLVPNLPLLNTTNNLTGQGSLGESAQTCEQQWGLPPKFLNVDYYNANHGSAFEVAAKYNNVTYNRTCCGMITNGGVRPGAFVGGIYMIAPVFISLICWMIL